MIKLNQAGYLTISDYDPKTELFILNYPNYEVAGLAFQYVHEHLNLEYVKEELKNSNSL